MLGMLGMLRMMTGLAALLASRLRPAGRANREAESDRRAAEALAEMRAANMAEEAEHQRLFAECSLPTIEVGFEPRSYYASAARGRCELCGENELAEGAACVDCGKKLCEECCCEDLCAPCYARSSTEPSFLGAAGRDPRSEVRAAEVEAPRTCCGHCVEYPADSWDVCMCGISDCGCPRQCERDPRCSEDPCAPRRDRELDEPCEEAAREYCGLCGENEITAMQLPVCLRCDRKLCEWCMYEEGVCNACYEKSLGGVA